MMKERIRKEWYLTLKAMLEPELKTRMTIEAINTVVILVGIYDFNIITLSVTEICLLDRKRTKIVVNKENALPQGRC